MTQQPEFSLKPRRRGLLVKIKNSVKNNVVGQISDKTPKTKSEQADLLLVPIFL